jgi:AcrR family transcriptional regulator
MDNKEKIIMKSISCFRNNGFNNTTVEEIARMSGLKKSSIYHYFKSKAELFQSAIHKEFELFIEKQKEIIQEDLPLEEKLKKYLNFRMIETFKFYKEYQLLNRDHSLPYHDIMHQETDDLVQKENEILQEIFRNYIKNEKNIILLCHLLSSISQSLVHKHVFIKKNTDHLEEEINALLQLLFDGFYDNLNNTEFISPNWDALNTLFQ